MKSSPHRRVIWPNFELTIGWALPILTARNQTGLHGIEEYAATKLPLLALSIETRVGALSTLLKRVDSSWAALKTELESEADVLRYVNSAFPFKKRRDLRSLQVDVHGYAVEARALFFNLAEFYRLFSSNYLNRQMGEKKSYEHLAGLAPGNWGATLKTVRDRITHGDTPSLEFSVTVEPLEFELLIDFNGMPREIGLKDTDVVTLSDLREIGAGLADARDKLAEELISAIRSAKDKARQRAK